MAWFHTVGIIGKNSTAPKVAATIGRVVANLRQRQVRVRFPPTMAGLVAAHGFGTAEDLLELDELGRRCDLIVVVGGDGTLLGAARDFSDYEVPLVGINLGRLGFLVDISPDEIEGRLDQVLNGHYDADTRTLIEVHTDAQPFSSAEHLDGVGGGASGPMRALNDVVIAKWNTVRMIEFETFVDGRFVNAQRGDGIIVSTPTGSTAYALSGGGPLIHPSLDALLLVPICPHTVSNRPIVVPGDARIEVRIRNFEPDRVRVTCDGQLDLPLRAAVPIRLERSHRRVRLLHPRGHDHYWLLRHKFGWGGQP